MIDVIWNGMLFFNIWFGQVSWGWYISLAVTPGIGLDFLLSAQTYGQMTSTGPLVYIIASLADTLSYKSQEYQKRMVCNMKYTSVQIQYIAFFIVQVIHNKENSWLQEIVRKSLTGYRNETQIVHF